MDVDGNDDKERGAVVLRGERRVSLEDDRSSPPTHQLPVVHPSLLRRVSLEDDRSSPPTHQLPVVRPSLLRRVSLEDDRSSPPTHSPPTHSPISSPSFTPPSSDNNITKTYRSDTSK